MVKWWYPLTGYKNKQASERENVINEIKLTNCERVSVWVSCKGLWVSIWKCSYMDWFRWATNAYRIKFSSSYLHSYNFSPFSAPWSDNRFAPESMWAWPSLCQLGHAATCRSLYELMSRISVRYFPSYI